MNAVSTLSITKTFGRICAVDHVSIEVPQGEIYGLLGMNGAGKTTMLNMLSTLAKPSQGDAFVGGASVRREPAAVRRNMAIVFENGSPPRPKWTVREYLTFCQEVRGQHLNADILRDLTLYNVLNRRTGVLSGGQKKRVELARALMSDTSVVLLDEPTKELDLKTKRVVWNVLRAEARNGRTLILSSHDVLEMKELCTSISVMREGEISASLSAEEIQAMDHRALESALVRSM